MKTLLLLLAWIATCVASTALTLSVSPWWGLGCAALAGFAVLRLTFRRPSATAIPVASPRADDGEDDSGLTPADDDSWIEASDDGIPRAGLYGAWREEDLPPTWRD